MEEEYSRRKQQRPTSASKSTIIVVILLLFLNTLALGFLLFLNIQSSTTHEDRLSSIEKQVQQLDKAQGTTSPDAVSDTTEHNVPVRETTTQASKTKESSSTTESSHQLTQVTPSSSEAHTEQQTERSTEQAATTYTVQQGDTLSVIAERNKLSLQELMLKNNLTDSTVYIGQVLSLQ